MSETRTRFLRAIADGIGAELIEEVHLFSALRQGGQETGVAVIAAAHEAAVDTGIHDIDASGSEALERSAIYRACYTLTRKGADRGKWEVEITEEAAAPLEMVDRVALGVHRRAGDDLEPERLNGDAFRAALVDKWTEPR